MLLLLLKNDNMRESDIFPKIDSNLDLLLPPLPPPPYLSLFLHANFHSVRPRAALHYYCCCRLTPFLEKRAIPFQVC